MRLVACLYFQKLEGRVASDEDLKLSDLLRYYERDSQAALVSHLRTHNTTHNTNGVLDNSSYIGSSVSTHEEFGQLRECQQEAGDS